MTSPSPSKPDHWKLAYDSLEPNIKSIIDSSKTHKRDVVAAALKVAKEKHEFCLKKRWKVKNFHGEAIVVRDVIEKVVKWIAKFKEIGDIAVQYDPVHASLPWAGVRLLLQLASNDAQMFCAIAENVELISRLVSCYKAFENFYMPSASAALTSQIADALVKLYAEILTFLADSIKYFDQRTPVRMITSVFRDLDSQQKKEILAVEADLLKLVNLADVESLLKVQKVVEDLSNRLKAVEDDHEHRELIQWVSPLNFHANHQDQLDKRIPGTGQWLLNHPEYKKWKSASSSSIFLLHGIPGCGKSILSSSVVEQYLNERKNNPVTEPFAYFYCADYENEKDRSQPQEILRSIVRQLAMSGRPRPEVRHILSSEFDQMQAKSKVEGVDMIRPRIEDCERLIMNITVDDPITIVVDALDEILDSERYVLLSLFERVVANAQNLVKIFLTSRSDSRTFDALPTASRLSIRSQDTRADMERFIRQLIRGAKGQGELLKSQDPALQESLIQTLLNEAGEMFQWAKCQFDLFRQLRVEEDIVNFIQHKHFDNLDQIYTKIMDKLLKNNGPSARRVVIDIISWLLYAQEPLTTDAFNSAVNSGRKLDVVDICANLVVLDTGSGMFRFSHQSVQEFARKLPEVEELNAHCTISLRCIESCSSFFADHPPNSGSLDRYSMLYWAYHSGLASQKQQASDLSRCMRHFIYDDDGELSQSFINWLEAIRQISASLERDHSQLLSLNAVHAMDPFDPTPFFAACVFGLDDILNDFEMSTLDQIDWDRKNSLNQTGLYLAAAMGHEKIIRKLLQHGADINAECPKRGNPVAAACFAGHLTSVRLLLENGASVPTSKTVIAALEAAFHGGQENAVLEILAHSRVQLDQAIYDSAILGASQHGFLGVMGKLRDPKMTAAFAQTDPHTRIHKIIGGGHIEALKRSVKDPADLLSSLPVNAVSTAALYGRDKMLLFLLENGLSIEAEGPLGSPLRVACLMNHQHVAQLLMARNANVNTSGPLGNALQAAAMKGYPQLVRLLLDNGADVNAGGGTYGNPLQAAAYHGHIHVVSLLLDAGAYIRGGGFTTDALCAAAEGGHESIVTLFLQKGYRFFDFDMGGLRSIAETNPFRPLLANYRESSPIEGQEKCGDRFVIADLPLEKATVVQSLLRKRLELEISDDDIYGLFLHAIKLGNLEVLWEFIEVSDDLLIEEAFEYAARNGYFDAMELLLDHPAVDRSSKAHLLLLLQSGNATFTEDGLRLLSKQLSASESMDHRVEALYEVVKRGSASPQVTQLLLKTQPSREPHRIQHIFQSACEAGDHQMVLTLYDALGGIDSMEDLLRSCLCTSAAEGCLDTVLFLVDHLSAQELGSKLDIPLVIAAGNGHLRIVKNLYEKMEGRDTAQASLSRALVAASENGHPSTVKFILDRGANVNTIAPKTPLQACLDSDHLFQKRWSAQAFTEQKAVLKLLISVGADPNTLGGMDKYPIFYACTYCDPEGLKCLIDAGADVNAVHSGGSAIHEVVKREMFSHTPMKQLLDAGAILPLTKGAVNPLLDKALSFFCGDGRFLEYESLEQVFDDGPGAVIEELLPLLPAEKVTDERYGLVLQMAACLGRTSVVEMLLERGLDVNIVGHHFGTPLQAASYHGNIETARLLLENGADPKILQGKHQTALRAAVIGNHKDLVNLLIDNGASLEIGAGVKLEDEDRSQRILNLAVENAAVDVLQILLNAGADAKTEYSGFEHPLITACEKGDYDKVEVLLDRGSPVNARGIVPPGWSDVPVERLSALHVACYQGFSQIARMLLAHGANPYPKCSSPARSSEQTEKDTEAIQRPTSALDLAASGGHLDCVRLLLAREIEVAPEAYGSALVEAAGHGHLDVVQEFLSRDLGTAYIRDAFLSAAGKHSRVAEILLELLLNSRHPVITFLIQNLKEIDEIQLFELLLDYCVMDTNTLILSCIKGSLTGVRRALENGISVDAEDEFGRRGLHAATYNRHLHIVKELISRGAHVNYVHAVYGSPLVLALEGLFADQLAEETNATEDGRMEQIKLRKNLGCSQLYSNGCSQYEQYGGRRWSASLLDCEHVVRCLLMHGAQCDDNSGPHGNALHFAVMSGNVAIVRLVLDNGADINDLDCPSGNSLVVAVKRKYLDVVKLLLERGADPQCTTAEGRSPLHVACRMDFSSAIRQLVSRGAKVNAKDKQGLSPLDDALEDLQEHGSQLERMGRPPNSVQVLLRNSSDVAISEDHLRKAAITMSYRKQSVLESFLDYDKDLVLPESVLISYLTNSWTDGRGLSLLLNRSGGLGVTAPMLQAARRVSVMEVLLDYRPICKITPTILEDSTDWECVQMLLAHDDQIRPTERVIIHALKSSHHRRISLSNLLERNTDLEVTQKMLESADHPRDLECLLARLSPQ